jgi:hypothetical protein
MHRIRALVVACAVLLHACGGAAGGAREAASGEPLPAAGPLAVLVLSGGGYHDFAGNLATLLVGGTPDAAVLPAARFDIVRLAPEGGDALPDWLLDGSRVPEHDVILAYTQGELGLPPAAREALLAFVRGGGGFVGLHCAADSHPGWAEYVAMLGGRFESHPPFGPVVVGVDVPGHPVTAGLPATWELSDEFYHLIDHDPTAVTRLMSGTSPAGGELRPVTWVRSEGAGRVAFTILGHGKTTHADPRFRRLVAQALVWAAGER